ncbi:Mth938-like domain-containing protein [Zavarzinia sp.]|uniref:Mth938-like domain-containing protein n=1 Tax=Zavarzinia sp. TaxID=2027920 RepID=UPI003BB4D59B|nr:Mth938-like domain-containing protein [Zavarzinia sp.]
MPPLRELDQAERRIERYGAGGFRIGGVVHEGGALVTERRTAAWPAVSLASLDADDVAPLIALRDEFEFVLIGCGPRFGLLPKAAKQALREAGIRFDVMDTGAACRTYNVLVAEGRRVAAALLPVA